MVDSWRIISATSQNCDRSKNLLDYRCSTMNLARYYRTLGLRRGASSKDVKVAYRQLVRQYHPDINPDAEAIEQFILINDAYTAVLEEIEAAVIRKESRQSRPLGGLNGILTQLEKLGISHSHESESDFDYEDSSEPSSQISSEPTAGEVSAQDVETANERIQAVQMLERPRSASEAAAEAGLKRDAYGQLKELLSQQKFPRAIALVEGLAHRMPADSEVSQWQAIVYQRWGRMLILQGQPHKARLYLKKALRTDPNNQSLWSEVNRDFWHLASLSHQSLPAV